MATSWRTCSAQTRKLPEFAETPQSNGTRVVFDLPFRPSGIALECTKRTGFVQFWLFWIDIGHSTLCHGRAIPDLQWIDELINLTLPRKLQSGTPYTTPHGHAHASREQTPPPFETAVQIRGALTLHSPHVASANFTWTTVCFARNIIITSRQSSVCHKCLALLQHILTLCKPVSQ